MEENKLTKQSTFLRTFVQNENTFQVITEKTIIKNKPNVQ